MRSAHELVCNGIGHLAKHDGKSCAYQEPPDLQEYRNTIHGVGTVATVAAIALNSPHTGYRFQPSAPSSSVGEHIAISTLGMRGDVQPYMVLATSAN